MSNVAVTGVFDHQKLYSLTLFPTQELGKTDAAWGRLDSKKSLTAPGHSDDEEVGHPPLGSPLKTGAPEVTTTCITAVRLSMLVRLVLKELSSSSVKPAGVLVASGNGNYTPPVAIVVV